MIVDDNSFLVYATKHYNTRRAISSEDFADDIKRFQYLKRLFKRYEENNDLKVRLILNHIIIIYNCFGIEASPMLFYKLECYHSYLKPILSFLNYLPEDVEYCNKIIYTSEIVSDIRIYKELKEL